MTVKPNRIGLSQWRSSGEGLRACAGDCRPPHLAYIICSRPALLSDSRLRGVQPRTHGASQCPLIEGRPRARSACLLHTAARESSGPPYQT
ncbi:hypothetical protein BC628DRAFT_1100416 [Trametes gibbosa]|nr:hypothetical protein BC628DRAFT_1100416 [Trametes gibbosa]